MSEAGGLDIGTLTGSIELDDRLSSALLSVGAKLDGLNQAFSHVGSVAAQHGGVASHAVEGVGHASKEAEVGVYQLRSAMMSAFHDPERGIESLIASIGADLSGAITATHLILVGAIAAIAGSITALGERGSTIQGVTDAFDRLAIVAGSTGNELRERLSAGVRGTVGEMELMQSVSRTMTAGVKLSGDQMQIMGEAARAMGKATGTDATQGLETLSSALTTGRTRGLAMAGIVVNVKEAEDNFAKSLGVTKDKLNEAGLLEAKRIAILAATQEYVNRLGVSELSFKERIEQATTAVGEWVASLEKTVAKSPAVLGALTAIGDGITQAFGGVGQTLLDTITSGINSFANGVTAAIPYVVTFIGWIEAGWSWLVKLNEEYQLTSSALSLIKGAFTFVGDAITYVKSAWEAMPEWLRTLTIRSVEAAAGLYLAGKAIEGTASFAHVFSTYLTTAISATSSFLQGVSSMPGAYAAVMAGAAKLFPTLMGVAGAQGAVALTGTAAIEAELGLAAASVPAAAGVTTLAASLAALGMVPFALVLLAGVVALGGAIAVAVQAYKLWEEHEDRVAAAARQHTVDQANLARMISFSGGALKDLSLTATNSDGSLRDMGKAMAWAKTHAAELRNEISSLHEVLRLLAVDDAGRATEELKKFSTQGLLTGDAMKEIAAKGREMLANGQQISPMIQAIITGLDQHEKALKKSGNATNFLKNEQEAMEKAIQSMVDTLEGDSKHQIENSQAIDRVIKSGNQDIDVKTRLVEAIDQLAGKHLKLTETQKAFYAANEGLGTRYIAQIEAITASWEEYEQLTMKGQGDSLAAQNAATNAWYAKQYAAIEKLGKKHPDEWARLAGINAQYHAKLVNNSEAYAQHEIEVANKIRDTWSEYYSLVAKSDGEILASQLSNIQKWYDDEVATIEKAAKVNADEWEKLGPLGALLWAKQSKARTDVANATTTRLIQADTELNDFVQKQTLTTTEFEVMKIWEVVNQQIAADALIHKTDADVNARRIELAKARTAALYTDETFLATHTKAALQEVANKAWQTYADMAQRWGEFNKAERDEILATAVAAQDAANGIKGSFGDMLNVLANDLTQLAQVSGSTFGGMVKDIAGVVVSFNQAYHAYLAFSKVGATKSEKAAALGDSALGVWSATDPNSHSKGGAVGGGMATGAVMGYEIGGGGVTGAIGAVIGAVVGGIIGLVRANTGWRKLGADVARDFGVALTDETLKQWEKEVELFGRQATEILHLKDIIGVTGLTEGVNLRPMIQKFRDTFSLIEAGQISVQQGNKVLDDSWAAFAEAGTDAAGLIHSALVEIIHLNDKFGTQSKAIADYIKGQLGGAAGGLNDLMTGLSDSATAQLQVGAQAHIDALKAAIEQTSGDVQKELQDELAAAEQAQANLVGTFTVTAQQGAGLAAAIVGNFAAMVDKGMSLRDALKTLQPAITGLQAALKASGVDGGAAFSLLTGMSRIASDAIMGPLASAIDGANAALKGLHNSGILNQDEFTALASMATDAFNKLIAGGADSASAMMLIQPELQTAWELEQKYGYTVDAATQALIDQAVANGTVGETHKSVADQMLDATNMIVEAVKGLAHYFGVILPSDIEHAAAVMKQKAKEMASDIIDIPPLPVPPSSPADVANVIDHAKTVMKPSSGGGPTVESLADIIKRVKEMTDAYAAAKGAVDSATQAQKDQVDALHAAGVATADIAKILGTTTQAVDEYLKRVADATTETKRLAAAEKAAIDSLASLVTSRLAKAATDAIALVGTVAAQIVSKLKDLQIQLRQTLQTTAEAAVQSQLDSLQKQVDAAKQAATDLIQLTKDRKALETQVTDLVKQQQAVARGRVLTSGIDELQKTLDASQMNSAEELALAQEMVGMKSELAILGTRNQAVAQETQLQLAIKNTQKQLAITRAGSEEQIALAVQLADQQTQLTDMVTLHDGVAQKSALQKQLDENKKLLDAATSLADQETALTAALEAKKAELTRLSTVGQIASLHERFDAEVEGLGPIPSEYERTYNAATDAIKRNLANQKAIHEADRLRELKDLKGASQEAIDAVNTKYDLMNQMDIDAANAQILALGPIPAAYEAAYGKAFDLVKARYRDLLATLGANPDWLNVPTPRTSPTPTPSPNPTPTPTPKTTPTPAPSSRISVDEAIARLQVAATSALGHLLDASQITSLGVEFANKYGAFTTSVGASDFDAFLNWKMSGGGIQYHATGGVVEGGARGTDTVPAMLTPGERVLTVSENLAYEAASTRDNTLMEIQGLRKEIAGLRDDMSDDRVIADERLARKLRDAIALIN